MLVAGARSQRQSTPDCVRFWPEARLEGNRYDHIVHVSNACQARAVCAVSTDVSPTPIRVEVVPAESSEVVTLRGATSADFAPRVECGLIL